MDYHTEAVDMAAFSHARGEPPRSRAIMRSRPQDFRVVEQTSIIPAEEGEHLWLWVEKTGLTTTKVVDCLAGALQLKQREIGYSGLKDRWAVTQQWFSLPWPIRHGDTFPFAADQVHEVDESGSFRVLRQHRHTRKLRRGAHDANAFVITLRDVRGVKAELDADLKRITEQGVPNYFGSQRFGYGGRNLALARALFDGKRLRRKQREFALSAARAFLFNSVLSARIDDQSWNHILPGEAVMLAGTHSVFSATGEDGQDLQRRVTQFDIHPSGPLPGRSSRPLVDGDAFAIEQRVLDTRGDLVNGLVDAGVDAARRTLRIDMRGLTWHWPDDDTLVVEMTLPPGSYATSVLRECVVAEEQGREQVQT